MSGLLGYVAVAALVGALSPDRLRAVATRLTRPGGESGPGTLLGMSRQRRSDADDAILFGELVALGLHAGLPLIEASTRAAAEVGGPVQDEVRALSRSAHRDGTAAAFAAATGITAPLYRLVARATATGAPAAQGIASFVVDAQRERRARRVAAAKRLPVRLLLPLSLLILPGFVVLTLGPALLSGLARLQL